MGIAQTYTSQWNGALERNINVPINTYTGQAQTTSAPAKTLNLANGNNEATDKTPRF